MIISHAAKQPNATFRESDAKFKLPLLPATFHVSKNQNTDELDCSLCLHHTTSVQTPLQVLFPCHCFCSLGASCFHYFARLRKAPYYPSIPFIHSFLSPSLLLTPQLHSLGPHLDSAPNPLWKDKCCCGPPLASSPLALKHHSTACT